MNIIDVAREAGVSKTTVSRVLTNSKLVKPETREKVLATIEKMGFVPNTSAQKLAGNRNYVIGIINSESINDPFYGYVEDWIAKECRKRDYGVIYTVTHDDRQNVVWESGRLYHPRKQGHFGKECGEGCEDEDARRSFQDQY